MCGTSPPAQGWFHAYQDVLDGSIGWRIRDEYVTVGLRECLHPFFKRAVLGLEVTVGSHGLAV